MGAGFLIDNGFIIFNDTDAQGDEEVGVMKIINGNNPPTSVVNTQVFSDSKLIKITDLLGREQVNRLDGILLYIYENGYVEKKIQFK